MKQIGEKIREIRKENGWSQDSIYPGHQSLMSQIEKGIIKNPSKEKLETIAKSLETTFDELIKDTSWDPTKEKLSGEGKYAFSTMDLSVTLHKSGVIEITMKAYPRYNENGEENKFSPDTGEELITCCPNESCGRNIENANQQFCMGCGKRIVDTESDDTGHKWSQQIQDTLDFWWNLETNLKQQKYLKITKKVLDKDHHRRIRNATWVTDEEWYRDFAGNEMAMEEAEKRAENFFDTWGDRDYWQDNYNLDGVDEQGAILLPDYPSPLQDYFGDGVSSVIPEFREYWKSYYQEVHIIDGLIEETKRYEVAIRSGEVEDISDIENNMDETINLDSEEKDS